MILRKYPQCKATLSIRGISLIAEHKILKGTVIMSLANLLPQNERTYQTIEIGEGLHVVEEIVSKLNHSCNPSVVVDTVDRVCVAARNIEKGEELNYFYPSTESEMIAPFECKCGSEQCIGFVNGALSLPTNALKGHVLNPHVRELLLANRYSHKFS